MGVVLNAVVLWTTRYVAAAVAQLRAEGHDVGAGCRPHPQ